MKKSKFYAPVVGKEYMERDMCSGYARLAAEELFGLKYNRGDAWNLRNVNSVVSNKGMINLDHLIPGQILGIYYPKSTFNDSSREYTHVALYVGREKGFHYIVQNFFNGGDPDCGVKVYDLEEFLKRHNCEIREVIEPPSGLEEKFK